MHILKIIFWFLFAPWEAWTLFADDSRIELSWAMILLVLMLIGGILGWAMLATASLLFTGIVLGAVYVLGAVLYKESQLTNGGGWELAGTLMCAGVFWGAGLFLLVSIF